MFDYKRENKMLEEADRLLSLGDESKAYDMIVDIFGNDTNHMYAHILTESNPEYSLHSKKLNKLVEKYLIKVLMSKIFVQDQNTSNKDL